MPSRPALRRALERERSRLLEPPLLVEALAQVGVGPPDAVVVADLLGDALGLAQGALAAGEVADPEARHAEAVERMTLEGARTHRAGDLDRALAGRPRLLARGAQHEDLGLGREHARQRGRRRVGRQHADRVAIGGQRAVAVARDPQVAAEALAGHRRGDHVAGAVGELDAPCARASPHDDARRRCACSAPRG